MNQHAFLQRTVGKWSGICHTWFESGVLADMPQVRGKFIAVLSGADSCGRLTKAAFGQGEATTGRETDRVRFPDETAPVTNY